LSQAYPLAIIVGLLDAEFIVEEGYSVKIWELHISKGCENTIKQVLSQS